MRSSTRSMVGRPAGDDNVTWQPAQSRNAQTQGYLRSGYRGGDNVTWQSQQQPSGTRPQPYQPRGYRGGDNVTWHTQQTYNAGTQSFQRRGYGGGDNVAWQSQQQSYGTRQQPQVRRASHGGDNVEWYKESYDSYHRSMPSQQQSQWQQPGMPSRSRTDYIPQQNWNRPETDRSYYRTNYRSSRSIHGDNVEWYRTSDPYGRQTDQYEPRNRSYRKVNDKAYKNKDDDCPLWLKILVPPCWLDD